MFRRRSCWVFDMDGTLTVAAHDFTGFKRANGVPVNRPILEHLGTLAPKAASALHEAVAAWEWSISARAEPAMGAHALLSHLTARGARLGILTRNRRDIALNTLHVAGLAGFFDPSVVLGRDEAQHKPSGDGIRIILATWDATPQTGVMVGDYAFDVYAGIDAGVATVFVGPDPLPTAAKPGADLHVTSLVELTARLHSEA